MRLRKLRAAALATLGCVLVAPTWGLSLATVGAPQPPVELTPANPAAAESLLAGSLPLVPLVASEMQATQMSTIDSQASSSGGDPVGKPMNDIAFVRVATENGRREAKSARDALPQLKAPELKRIAELVVSDHTSADARLNKIAAVKQWPVPGPSLPAAPPSGSASGDFDARWVAEMIDAHERSLALYRAQAAGGEDKDLRNYARDTLPTIEQHLAQLKNLQK